MKRHVQWLFSLWPGYGNSRSVSRRCRRTRTARRQWWCACSNPKAGGNASARARKPGWPAGRAAVVVFPGQAPAEAGAIPGRPSSHPAEARVFCAELPPGSATAVPGIPGRRPVHLPEGFKSGRLRASGPKPRGGGMPRQDHPPKWLAPAAVELTDVKRRSLTSCPIAANRVGARRAEDWAVSPESLGFRARAPQGRPDSGPPESIWKCGIPAPDAGWRIPSSRSCLVRVIAAPRRASCLTKARWARASAVRRQKVLPAEAGRTLSTPGPEYSVGFGRK